MSGMLSVSTDLSRCSLRAPQAVPVMPRAHLSVNDLSEESELPDFVIVEVVTLLCDDFI